MAWPAIIGAVASVAGSALSSKGSSPSSSRYNFRPANVGGDRVGNFGFSPQGQMQFTASNFDNRSRDFYEDQFRTMAADPMDLQSAGLISSQMGYGALPQAAQESLLADYSRSDAALAPYLQSQGLSANALGMAGRYGVGQGFAGPSAGAIGASALGQAQGLFGQAGNQQALVDSTKSQLDQLARPGEEQLVNSKMQGLFNTGRLGVTGGAQQMGEMQTALANADTQRAIQAQQLGMQNQQQLLGLGQGFLGQGLGAVQADQSHTLGMGQLGGSLLGQGSQVSQSMLDSLGRADQNLMSRADQRLSNVQGLFGFGQQLFEAPTGMAARAYSGMAPLDAKLFDLGNLSVAGSQARSGQSSSGATSGSAMGAALQGMGSGLFNQSMRNNQWFGGGGGGGNSNPSAVERMYMGQ